MKFRKYNSIEKKDKQELIDRVYQEEMHNDRWVVTEKCHGSNLSLWANAQTGEVQIAKRSSFLKGDEIQEFFRSDIVLEKYRDVALEISRYVQAPVAIYGEMIGGHFAHKDYPEKDPDGEPLQAVQKGISYTPERDWLVFDIAWMNDEGEFNFYSWDFVLYLVSKMNNWGYGIKTVPFFFEDTFDNCMEFCQENVESFKSSVPDLYGLPNLQDNFAEGFVVKPNEYRRFVTGKRAIFKVKNPLFRERGEGKKKEKKGPDLTEKGEEMMERITGYVTRNRLDNLISKEGEPDRDSFGKFIGMLNKDVIEDFLKDNEEEFNQLEKSERKQIQKSVGKFSKELLTSYMMEKTG